jgi:hypothetical protein
VNTLTDLLPGFALNMVVGFIIIGFIYYPSHRSKHEFVFTYFVFNILIYFISGLLRDVQLTIGFGFGLLAVFSTLRYRTERMPIRETTFLFICISMPFINQLFLSTRISFGELAAINTFIVVAILVLDRRWGVHYEEERRVLYEKIDLIRPENYELLLDDLRQRTGLQVKRCVVDEINLMRDMATITIYYDPIKEPIKQGN